MRNLYIILLAFVLFTGCGKEENYIPEVRVEYGITLQQFSINTANSNGVLLVPNYGVAGLIIVRTPLGGYMAFDRCSSVNPENKCQITPDDNSFLATDPCSGAKFSLLDGSPQKAPGEKSLKVYTVTILGNTNLRVTN